MGYQVCQVELLGNWRCDDSPWPADSNKTGCRICIQVVHQDAVVLGSQLSGATKAASPRRFPTFFYVGNATLNGANKSSLASMCSGCSCQHIATLQESTVVPEERQMLGGFKKIVFLHLPLGPPLPTI